jgi:E3 ubiquitin-protein ligase Mdm2
MSCPILKKCFFVCLTANGSRRPNYASVTPAGKPISSPAGDANQDTGRPGPPDRNELCTVCLLRPKNASFVHGATGHVCCCLQCARDFHERQADCPICSDPIEHVIEIRPNN